MKRTTCKQTIIAYNNRGSYMIDQTVTLRWEFRLTCCQTTVHVACISVLPGPWLPCQSAICNQVSSQAFIFHGAVLSVLCPSILSKVVPCDKWSSCHFINPLLTPACFA